MSDVLSDDDAHILNLESTAITGHTLKLLILEPGSLPLDLDALKSAVGQRLSTQPRATQRVDSDGEKPRWVAALQPESASEQQKAMVPSAQLQHLLMQLGPRLHGFHVELVSAALWKQGRLAIFCQADAQLQMQWPA
jgi:hypothetical protein